MPPVSGPLGAAAPLAAALGVTRVARITGLDRTGVEVACAVRPRGHVLQVTNGKGPSRALAALGALLEAAELSGAERAGVDRWGDAEGLASGGAAVIAPDEIEPSTGPASRRVRIAWRLAEDLASGGSVLVPACAVHCPPPSGPSLGPAFVTWTSNGSGAHASTAAAMLHAILELVERDQLARALPEGFTGREVASRLLDKSSLPAAAPGAAALALELEARGIAVHLLDATGPLGIPCAAALLVEPAGPVPLAAGYACRTRRDRALLAALHEAAQSRATEIHGAREDVAESRSRPAAEDLSLPRRGGRRDASRMPDLRARTPGDALREVVRRLARAGHRRVAMVPLDAPAGWAVCRAVVPGLAVSGLL